jgi:hypothetical protein
MFVASRLAVNHKPGVYSYHLAVPGCTSRTNPMVTGKWVPVQLIGSLRPTCGCGILSALFVLGDAKPEKEAVTIIEE